MEAVEKFIKAPGKHMKTCSRTLDFILLGIPEVSNPIIVVIVGCLGLISNLVGLALFHGI
jgi:hypothetical protein